MIPSRCLAAALAAAFALGAAARAENKIPDDVKAVLDKAEKFELISLDPGRDGEKPKDGFHGWKVLGQTEVKDADTRKKLVAALEKGVKENDGRVAACFNPRHGIKATHDGKTVELVICFECLSISGWTDGEPFSVLTSRKAEETFNKTLTDRNVPLPKGRDE